jgi:hypothetical protein
MMVLCVCIYWREKNLAIYSMINSVYLINLLFIATMIFYGPSTFILFDEWGLKLVREPRRFEKGCDKGRVTSLRQKA